MNQSNPIPDRLGAGASLAGPGYSAEPEPSSTVSAVPVSIPSAGMVSVPRDAPEAMWDGLPRAIMLWLDFERPTPDALFKHLRCSGYEVPAWMLEEGELKALNHVPSKGTRCVLIYRAMVENWLAAIATEARRAETPQSGSVHESAGPKGHRP